MLAFACLLSASACGGSSSASRELPIAPVATQTVTVKDFAFDPYLRLSRGGDRPSRIANAGAVPHSYTVKDTDVNLTLDPGDSGTADLRGSRPGTYAVVCTYPPADGGRAEGRLRARTAAG